MLTVVSVVEDNSLGLADLMIKSVNKFTNIEHKILIIDNAGTNDNLEEYPNVYIINNKNKVKGLVGGSNRHGCALNTARPFVDDFIISVLDSDTVVLKDGWWMNLPVALKECGKPHMCLFSTNLYWFQSTDWSPGNPSYSSVSYPPELDVGWRCEPGAIYFQRGQLVDCKEGGSYFKGLQCDEIYDFNKNLIATHLGRGSNLKSKANRGLGSHLEQLAKWKDIIKQLTGVE